MPKLGQALLSLGKLIGLLDQSGAVSWVWFGAPQKTLSNVATNRTELGPLMRALLNSDDGPTVLVGTNLWVPLAVGPVHVGLAWTPNDDLRLGLGVKAGGDDFGVAVLARLLKVPGDPQVSELGAVQFSGELPKPEFLTSASIDGSVEVGSTSSFGLTVANAVPEKKALVLESDELIWDCLRLVVFVLQSWVQAETNDPFLARLNEHLFPMLGKPESDIKAFPLFDGMGTLPKFEPWAGSVLTLEGNAAGALTFLWHARALITGNEDPDFLEGSLWFPLTAGSGAVDGQPPVGGKGKPFEDSITGAFIGITLNSSVPTLALRLRKDSNDVTIALAAAQTPSGITRPKVKAKDLDALEAFFASQETEPLDYKNGLLTILSGTASSKVEGFDGSYKLGLLLVKEKPVGYSLAPPNGPTIDVPPGDIDGKKLLGLVVLWVVNALSAEESVEVQSVMKALGTVIAKSLDPAKSPDPMALLRALAPLLNKGLNSPAELNVAGNSLLATASLGPLAVGPGSNPPIHLGRMYVEAHYPESEFIISLSDLRLGPKSPGVSPDGLLGALLPDLRQVPGFSLKSAYNGTNKAFTLSGGGKVPIQRTLGPFEIAALLVAVDKEWLTVGIDLSFELAALRITAFELGVRYPFDDKKAPDPFLHGLGLSFDSGAVKLSGMFGAVGKAGATDYVGGAVVSVADSFELSAIGGYTQVQGQPASLFLFGSLVTPLGGPPWCFVTGIAGGFGYNRALPPPGLLARHPFLQVMSGELELGGDAMSALEKLSGAFQVQEGQHWVAAGLQFVSFGFINGKLVLALGMGSRFSLTLSGTAAFGINPVAYFELGFEATADADHLLVLASISPNSYFIDPDLFNLRGDFALGVWYGGHHAGDFLLSIGGYHRHFTPPTHYPDLSPVGVKAMYGVLRLSVEGFFACTPRALMGGAKVSLSGEFAGIGAGLEVGMEVYIEWEPFLIQATLKVTVWFEFWGRHEVGVALEIHTPPFGGLATIDAAVTSFEIDFGEALERPPPPALHQFLTKQLGIPARWHKLGAAVERFNSATAAGLLRVDVLSGRAVEAPAPTSAEQEGLGKSRIAVNAEFSFSVSTNLPLGDPLALESPATVQGNVNLPLCNTTNLTSKLTIGGPKISSAKIDWQADLFPAATFGPPIEPSQADEPDAASAIAAESTEKPVVALYDRAVVTYRAKTDPVEDDAGNLGAEVRALEREDSLPGEDYPLPLGWPEHEEKKPVFGTSRPTYLLGAVPAGAGLISSAPTRSRREHALASLRSRRPRPLRVSTTTGALQRIPRPPRFPAMTVAGPPAAAPLISPPMSPLRRRELFAVSLRVLPITSPVTRPRQRLETRSRAPGLARRDVRVPVGAEQPFSTSLTVTAGRAVVVDLSGDGLGRGHLALNGRQTVRVVFLGSAGEFISDNYVTGDGAIRIPSSGRRAVLVGEGFDPPLADSAGASPSAPMRSVGIEHDSVLLAVGPKVMAGHGCVVDIRAEAPQARSLLDSVPGFVALGSATNVRLFLPPLRRGWSAVLRVAPRVADPGPASDQVHWLSVDATLRHLHPVISPDETALVMGVEASTRWSLDVDLSPRWRLVGVALSPGQPRELARLLSTRSAWDLVDDRFGTVPRAVPSTNVTLEVG
ncbi:MAG TPA: DUF6603 domain-containing protein [Acidimicrobiales bacterium]|nr:DUF6603 domain-containing protein [Acidimicrobiales bacterium]